MSCSYTTGISYNINITKMAHHFATPVNFKPFLNKFESTVNLSQNRSHGKAPWAFLEVDDFI